jgi:pimeloyl-ACP methyl ester carboxylesterase
VRLIAFLAVLFLSNGCLAQDYEREARWKSEVLGNLVVGDAVDLRLPSGRSFLALYTAGKPESPAIVLAHGVGVHPDHGIIGTLRVALADMGFTTLSIQMPVLAAAATPQDYHPALFPEAGKRLAAAAEWLKGKGQKRIVLASHSLGAWMSAEYLKSSDVGYAAWVCMGLPRKLHALPFPVLDVYGENDLPAVLRSAPQRRAAVQVRIAGADHFYNDREAELAAVLKDFISGL